MFCDYCRHRSACTTVHFNTVQKSNGLLECDFFLLRRFKHFNGHISVPVNLTVVSKYPISNTSDIHLITVYLLAIRGEIRTAIGHNYAYGLHICTTLGWQTLFFIRKNCTSSVSSSEICYIGRIFSLPKYQNTWFFKFHKASEGKKGISRTYLYIYDIYGVKGSKNNHLNSKAFFDSFVTVHSTLMNNTLHQLSSKLYINGWPILDRC